MGLLRVALFYDDEAGNWHYRAPALHINGGGTPTAKKLNSPPSTPSRSRCKVIDTTSTQTPRRSPST